VNTDEASGVQVWSSQAWRERAVDWLDEQLIEAAIERTGEVEQPRIRPWATLLTAPTTAGRVWLKAAAPSTAYEASLYLVLHRVTPARVLAPLAADPGRGWILLPDGGPPLSPRLEAAELVDAMAVALDRYGRMQRDLAPHLGELLATGAPDMRPAIMPERFEEALVAASEHVERRGSAADRHALERLEALRPTVARWCERLDRMPGAPSLDHNDLHPGNVLTDEHGDVGHARFYDWGDAVLAHPFASMLATLQFMRTYAGCDGTGIRRLRDAYLAAFADLAPVAELIETLELACRVGHIARALTWERAIRADPGFDERWERAPFESLVALLDDCPPESD